MASQTAQMLRGSSWLTLGVLTEFLGLWLLSHLHVTHCHQTFRGPSHSRGLANLLPPPPSTPIASLQLGLSRPSLQCLPKISAVSPFTTRNDFQLLAKESSRILGYMSIHPPTPPATAQLNMLMSCVSVAVDPSQNCPRCQHSSRLPGPRWICWSIISRQ